jgi:hypothetical protein
MKYRVYGLRFRFRVQSGGFREEIYWCGDF